MELIPSLDLLHGRVVRLTHGDFATAKVYGDAEEVLDALDVPRGTRLHVVDLEASRSGKPIETDIVRRLARRDLIVQVGGGIRSLDDAKRWLDCGAERIVVGTAATSSLLDLLVTTFGPQRIVPAIDVRDGVVRTDGWTRESNITMREIFARVESLAIPEALVTDISKDGALRGPSFALYRQLNAMTRVKIIASGGVSQTSDVISLARLGNVSGCVIGKALLERRVDLHEARARLAASNAVPERVIPCLDVRAGRVVKGVSFVNIRDAGDPVECAMRYEEEGADELVILDIAGDRSSIDTVRRVAESIFIPLTVGGGIRSVEDFRDTLRAGADRVAINTAALHRPELIAECSREFGVQAVVLSVDAKGGQCAVHGGKEVTNFDAIEWCKRGEQLGAGEILLTSVDRDGTNSGFDIELLRAATSVLKIGVIASGGAGTLDHFRDAIEAGGARAVLAASLFHDRVLTVGDVKRHLEAEGIPVR
ncbi:MAG: imidazole glycerol phosphate synthase subunit HisF [Acidobacteria bacterium]|nr:MAG: imidazole glycerol phosphate synthase subunit HisF [Acidobacteriota bacterium]